MSAIAHNTMADKSKANHFFILSVSLAILTVAGAIFGYLKITKPETNPIKTQEKSWVVSTVSITPTTLAPTLTLYGRVESPKNAILRTPNFALTANTAVIVVAVLEGEAVRKNQLLIQLDDQDSQLNLKQREAEVKEIEAQISAEKQNHASNLIAITHEETLLKLAQATAKRAKQLKQQRVGSQAALEDAQQLVARQRLTVVSRQTQIKTHPSRLAQLQAKRSKALALWEVARLEWQRTKILAPFNGIVSTVSVSVGDRVRSGDALVTLYDNTALEVRAQIPTQYTDVILQALSLRQTLMATAQIDAHPLLLGLDRVSGQVNRNSGGIDGLFLVMKGANTLRLGQFLNLFLTLPAQSQVVALPLSALYGKDRIYKFVAGRMQGLTVEPVGQYLDKSTKEIKVLIRNPLLKANDQIITTSLPNALEGLKVQAISIKH